MEIGDRVEKIEADIMLLKRIILGDQVLGLPPINDRLSGIEDKLDKIERERRGQRQILIGVAIGIAAEGAGIAGILIKLFA